MNEPVNERHYDVFVPVLLALTSLVVWFGFQTAQLLQEGADLQRLRANQDAPYENAQKMRAQLNAIAADTARLADAGNPRAIQVVNALRAKGVTLTANAAEPPSGGSAPEPSGGKD